MQAYRLEMGTKFANDRGADLYQFWGDLITTELNKMKTRCWSTWPPTNILSRFRKDIGADYYPCIYG